MTQPPAALAELLSTASHASFVGWVSQVERVLGDAVDAAGRRVPAEARIVFRHDAALAFSAGDLRTASWNPEGAGGAGAVEVTTTFLGLSGAASPLPLFMCEEVAQEDPYQPLRRDLLDVFHNRLIGTLARALQHADYPISFRTGGDDGTSSLLSATMGDPAGEGATAERVHWLRYAAAFALGRNTRDALEALLRDALAPSLGDAELTVECFRGGLESIAREQQVRLGETSVLGRTFLLGQKARAVSSKVAVAIGELDVDALPTFMPGGDGFRAAREVFAGFVSSPIDADLELVLKPGAGTSLRLGSARLAATSFLGTPRERTRLTIPLCGPSRA